MGWKESLTKAAEFPGKFLSNGGHAQQDIPAQHRLLNAGVMALGWWVMDQLRHVAFGLKMEAEGEYVEVKRDEVPFPLRFLHKTIDWDPHSETSENQWKKILYQVAPGIGAGVGAVAGSMYAFERNTRAQQYGKLKGLDKLNLLDADYAAQYSQSPALRALAGFFGTFSAASGLTFLYGMFLNNAFAASNGAVISSVFSFAKKGNLAPHRAAEAQIAALDMYLKEGQGAAWAQQFVDRVMTPMFGHALNTPELQAKAVVTLQGKVKEYLDIAKKDPSKAKILGEKIASDLVNTLHLDLKKAKLGNANPWTRHFQDFINTIGLGRAFHVGDQPKQSGMGWGLPIAGLAAVGGTLAIANSSSAKESHHGAPNQPGSPGSISFADPARNHHSAPDPTGKTPAEYTYEAMALHHAENGNAGGPPKWLKWMGEAQLAVFPKNRFWCAIGLTSGLMIAGNMAKIATGHGLDGKAVDATKVPTFLKWLHKSVKYDPKSLNTRNRWIRYAQWGTYSLGGLFGIKLGTDYAYSSVKEKNANPHYIEDYLPRVSMHQGETWSWLAAFSGIFGSASGLFTLPIPGLNYALGLAGRTTSMQDRNFMIPGLNSMMSGATTTSFLRLREGLTYLCHYAVNNPEQTPAQIEFLAFSLLGPIFKDKLKVEHIQQFTEAVHEVRDRFWQPGGIPKEKRVEALKAMQEVFTGAGFEVLMIDLGLNPGTISFDNVNGITGAIGNVGAASKVRTEQEAYQKALLSRLPEYVSEGVVSPERAHWVKADIEAFRAGKPGVTPLPSESIRPTKLFSDRPGIQKQESKLLLKSRDPGDWRTKAGFESEHPAPAAIGG